MVINGIYWGQCDIIYTFFLLVFFWFSLRRMPSAAACAFGLAFAFKAQSVFLAPYLLYLDSQQGISGELSFTYTDHLHHNDGACGAHGPPLV